MLEGIANVLHPKDNDNEDTQIQMVNPTSQPTLMLPQLMQQIQQMQILMEQMKTQLNNSNKNGGSDNSTSGGNNINKVPFWRQLYFWTHGACNHQGIRFRSKAEGQKYNATLN